MYIHIFLKNFLNFFIDLDEVCTKTWLPQIKDLLGGSLATCVLRVASVSQDCHGAPSEQIHTSPVPRTD
jgi:hypothetical protein